MEMEALLDKISVFAVFVSAGDYSLKLSIIS